MALITTIKNFTLANASGFPKLERDAMIRSASKSMFDFGNSYCVTGSLIPANSEINNLVQGAGKAKIVGADRPILAKGLVFSDSDGVYSGATIDSGFDLKTYGAEASALIQFWMTMDTVFDAAGFYNAVIGYAYQTGANCQWSVSQGYSGSPGSNGGTGALVVNMSGNLVLINPVKGKPELVTLVVKRETSSNFKFDVYLDKTKVGSSGSINYPFSNPLSGSSSEKPQIGILGGYAAGWRGKIHRVHAMEIDPKTFDAAAFIAEEYDRNYSRFV